jgi:hypothetical protein
MDNVRVARLQQSNDLVGKAVLEDAVAETQQFIDLPHDVQSTGQAAKIAMQIGDDAELHECIPSITMNPAPVAKSGSFHNVQEKLQCRP